MSPYSLPLFCVFNWCQQASWYVDDSSVSRITILGFSQLRISDLVVSVPGFWVFGSRPYGSCSHPFRFVSPRIFNPFRILPLQISAMALSVVTVLRLLSLPSSGNTISKRLITVQAFGAYSSRINVSRILEYTVLRNDGFQFIISVFGSCPYGSQWYRYQ